MKKITFLGNSLNSIKTFEKTAMREAGFQLDAVQRGFNPTDWKPMNSVGKGVREIRIHEKGEYRVIYVTKFEKSIYVLHAFKKKTQKTNKQDIDAAKRAYKLIPEVK